MLRGWNYAQYQLGFFRLNVAQRKLDKTRPEENEENHTSGRLAYFYHQDEELFECKRLIQTRYYRRLADLLEVPMPDTDDPAMYGQVEWDSDPSQPKYLSDEGLRVVRAAIRAEQKHQREAVSYWFAIAIGLIGAFTGLVSAFKG